MNLARGIEHALDVLAQRSHVGSLADRPGVIEVLLALRRLADVRSGVHCGLKSDIA
jgi:hypothetical protein